MRRTALVLVMAIVASAAFIGSAQATSPLTCSSPTHLTGNEGTLHFPGNLTVQQDVWSPRKGTKQTMDVCSPSNWVANVTATGQPEAGVTTYPDSGTTYPDSCAQTHKLSEFSSITSTYATTPPTAKASWDYAYDIFLGGGICKASELQALRHVRATGGMRNAANKSEPFTEVMMWPKWSDVSVPNAQLHYTIDGVAYDIFHSGGYIQVRRHDQNTSGSVNLGKILATLVYVGLLGNVHLIFVQDGYEVLTTFGAQVAFPISDFSVTETLK